MRLGPAGFAISAVCAGSAIDEKGDYVRVEYSIYSREILEIVQQYILQVVAGGEGEVCSPKSCVTARFAIS